MHETKQTLNNYKASVNFLNEILPVPLSHKRGMLIIISGQDSQHFVATWTELQKKPLQIKKTSTSHQKCFFIVVCMFPCEKHFGLCQGRLWLWPHRAPQLSELTNADTAASAFLFWLSFYPYNSNGDPNDKDFAFSAPLNKCTQMTNMRG